MKKEFEQACELCEYGMRKVAIEMAKTSMALIDAKETPTLDNKAALYVALQAVNHAYFDFLQTSGIAYLHTQENQAGDLTNPFAADLKKAFEMKQAEPDPDCPF